MPSSARTNFPDPLYLPPSCDQLKCRTLSKSIPEIVPLLPFPVNVPVTRSLPFHDSFISKLPPLLVVVMKVPEKFRMRALRLFCELFGAGSVAAFAPPGATTTCPARLADQVPPIGFKPAVRPVQLPMRVCASLLIKKVPVPTPNSSCQLNLSAPPLTKPVILPSPFR